MHEEKGLSKQIADCDCRSRQSDPFFFPLRNQRVMVITACPSIQTVSTTLLSVRFVRQMLYALLGEDGISDEGLSLLFSKKGIYWTHLHKCYNEKFYSRSKDTNQYLLQNLPGECAAKYLAQELDQLSHSLKLLVVMGKQTCRSASIYIDQFRGTQNASGKEIEIVEIDYLQNETPEKYYELRAKVAQALGQQIKTDKVDPSILDTAKTRLQVGFDMELAAINNIIQTDDPKRKNVIENTLTSPLDEKWLELVMVPQKKRQAILFSAWSVIENSMTSFFLDVLDPISWKSSVLHSSEWLKDTSYGCHNGLAIDGNPDFRSLTEFITNCGELWLMGKFVDYLTYGRIPEKYKISVKMREYWKDLETDLDLMRRVRNIITHRSGFFSTAELERSEAPVNEGWSRENKYYLMDSKLEDSSLSGVKVITNTVYLDCEAQTQISDLTKELLEFIVQIDEHINK